MKLDNALTYLVGLASEEVVVVFVELEVFVGLVV